MPSAFQFLSFQTEVDILGVNGVLYKGRVNSQAAERALALQKEFAGVGQSLELRWGSLALLDFPTLKTVPLKTAPHLFQPLPRENGWSEQRLGCFALVRWCALLGKSQVTCQVPGSAPAQTTQAEGGWKDC